MDGIVRAGDGEQGESGKGGETHAARVRRYGSAASPRQTPTCPSRLTPQMNPDPVTIS
jgi:hypothetical protein